MKLEKLLDGYRQTSREYAVAMEQSSVRGCNRCWNKMVRLRAGLREHGEEGRRQVLALLDDEDPAVRLSAAADALDWDAPEDGLRVLRELASGPQNQVTFNAKMIIQQWQTGAWQRG